MPSFTSRLGLVLAALALHFGVTDRALADLVLTLDTTDPTFVLPTQGSTTFVIDGTLRVTSPDTSATIAILQSPIFNGTALTTFIDPNVPQSNNITYTGHILDITLTSTDAPDDYTLGQLQAQDPQIQDMGPRVDFSVTVASSVSAVPEPSAAPEPSTAILAVFGAVVLIAYRWTRLRRGERRQAAA